MLFDIRYGLISRFTAIAPSHLRERIEAITFEMGVPAVNRVPIEIWHEIFRNAVILEHPKKRLAYRLASVCRTWRSSALRASELWTTILVELDRPLPSNPGRDGEFSIFPDLLLLQLSLQRSRSRPLQVEILRREYVGSLDGAEEDREKFPMLRVIRLLYPHLSRIQSLTVEVLYSQALAVLLVNFTGSANILQRLSILRRHRDPWEDPLRPSIKDKDRTKPFAYTPAEAYFQAPNLHMLNLTASTCLTLDTFKNWSSVRDLTISEYNNQVCENIRPTTLLELLQSLPSLTSLVLEGYAPQSNPPAANPSSTSRKTKLTSLRNLDVRDMPMPVLQEFLERLQAPSVDTLAIRGVGMQRGMTFLYTVFERHETFPSLRNVTFSRFCGMLVVFFFVLDFCETLTLEDINHPVCKEGCESSNQLQGMVQRIFEQPFLCARLKRFNVATPGSPWLVSRMIHLAHVRIMDNLNQAQVERSPPLAILEEVNFEFPQGLSLADDTQALLSENLSKFQVQFNR